MFRPHKKGLKEKKFYTPSLSAEVAGISGKHLKMRGFTGLEIRPMLERKSKSLMLPTAGRQPKEKKLNISSIKNIAKRRL
jgi:hypothetical protein